MYPLVNIRKTMENHNFLTGKSTISTWAIFNRYVSHYQRVNPISTSAVHHRPAAPLLQFLRFFGWRVQLHHADGTKGSYVFDLSRNPPEIELRILWDLNVQTPEALLETKKLVGQLTHYKIQKPEMSMISVCGSNSLLLNINVGEVAVRTQISLPS